MATLNPFGLLVLYIALSSAPSSVPQVAVTLSEYQHMTFVRDVDPWWYTTDDLGNKVYYRLVGTSLVAGFTKDKAETQDLKLHFELTGKEDWRKPQHLQARAPEQGDVDTDPVKSGIHIQVDGEIPSEVIVEWTIVSKKPLRHELTKPSQR